MFFDLTSDSKIKVCQNKTELSFFGCLPLKTPTFDTSTASGKIFLILYTFDQSKPARLVKYDNFQMNIIIIL